MNVPVHERLHACCLLLLLLLRLFHLHYTAYYTASVSTSLPGRRAKKTARACFHAFQGVYLLRGQRTAEKAGELRKESTALPVELCPLPAWPYYLDS